MQVEETASTVTVTASVRLSAELCDAMFPTEDVEVVLDEPLGDRMLRGCETSSEGAVQLGPPNRDCLQVRG